MSVVSSVKYVRVAGNMVIKPINIRVAGAWQPILTGELYVTPSSGSYNVNDTVTMTIRENSFSTLVNSLQANLSYNASVLQFVSSDVSASQFESPIQNTGGSGTIQIGLGSFDGSVSGDQLVATITFTAIASGTANIAFTSGSGIARSSDTAEICNRKLGASYTVT